MLKFRQGITGRENLVRQLKTFDIEDNADLDNYNRLLQNPAIAIAKVKHITVPGFAPNAEGKGGCASKLVLLVEYYIPKDCITTNEVMKNGTVIG